MNDKAFVDVHWSSWLIGGSLACILLRLSKSVAFYVFILALVVVAFLIGYSKRAANKGWLQRL